MAEQPKNGQSKGIGELFVEFGTKGVPGLLKNLNSVSASFLLGKNAASQFVDIISKPIKEAGKGAVAIGKLAASFGTTLEEAARLKLFFKNYNLSEGLVGDLVNISDMLTKVRLGIGGISGEFAYAMHRMGLNWQDYDGSIESMIRMRNDVENAIKDMNPAEQRIMRQNVGLSNPEWAYAAEKGELNLDDYKSISETQIQNLINMSEATSNLGASFEQLGSYITEKFSPAVIKVSKFLSDQFYSGSAGEFKEAGKNYAHWGQSADIMGIGAKMADWSIEKINNIYNNYNKNQGVETGGASMIDNSQGYLGELPDLAPPSAFSSNSTSIYPTININNTNNITGDNAQDIANKINAINMQNIEYAQYQVSNLGAK